MIAWHRAQHDTVCDRVEPWPHGRLVRSSEFPAHWDFNLVYATGPLAGLDAEALLRVAEEHHGDLAHRQLQVEDEGAGARLRPRFDALAVKATPLLHLAHAGDLPPVPAGVRVRAAPDPEAEPLRRRWYAEEPWARDPATLERFLRAEARVHERLGGHVLLVDGPRSGAPIAYARVRTAGDTGAVAEAYTAPEARGRGLGGALVAAAVRAIAAAGARHALIVADGEGRPQRLYRRLGFRPVWTLHQFLRMPGTT